MGLLTSARFKDKQSNAEAFVYSFLRNDGQTQYGAVVACPGVSVDGEGEGLRESARCNWHRLFFTEENRNLAVQRAFWRARSNLRRIHWFAK